MKKILLCLLTCIIVFFTLSLTGCAANSQSNPETTAVYEDFVVYATIPKYDNRLMYDVMEISYEQAVTKASYIVDAEFLGFLPEELEARLLFRVTDIYKGTFENDHEIIVVSELASEYRLDRGEVAEYIIGQEYMLVLNKKASVYRDYDLYTQYGCVYMPKSDEDWENCHTETAEILASSVSINSNTATENQSKPFFTTSEKVSDALDIANSVFVLKIDSIFDDTTNKNTIIYRCLVEKTIRGEPNNNGYLLIPFFRDTVEVGKQYLALLTCHNDKTEVYNIASRNSVFTLEEVAKDPLLVSLLGKAVDYTAIVPERGSFAEELEKEMEQFAEELEKDPELKERLEKIFAEEKAKEQQNAKQP